MPKETQQKTAEARKGEDLGTRFAAHWTAAENKNRLLVIKDIEVARAERRKNYATITKEYIVIRICISQRLPLLRGRPSIYPPFSIRFFPPFSVTVLTLFTPILATTTSQPITSK